MKEYVTPVGAGTPEKGRNEIPIPVAAMAQTKLLDLMIPDSIRPYLLNPEEDTEKDDPILIDLGNLWAAKYVLGFNGFTEYCNSKSADLEFMERAKLGQFTDSEYQDMVNFLQQHVQGEPFFADEEAVQDFLRPHLH